MAETTSMAAQVKHVGDTRLPMRTVSPGVMVAVYNGQRKASDKSYPGNTDQITLAESDDPPAPLACGPGRIASEAEPCPETRYVMSLPPLPGKFVSLPTLIAIVAHVCMVRLAGPVPCWREPVCTDILSEPTVVTDSNLGICKKNVDHSWLHHPQYCLSVSSNPSTRGGVVTSGLSRTHPPIHPPPSESIPSPIQSRR